MTFDKIFILGAGAIGSVYGALLSENNDVRLIGNKAHVEAVKAKGLSIIGDTRGTFPVHIATKIEVIPERSLVVLTTKAYDSAEAIKKIRKFLRKDTVILVLQNGLGNEDIVKMIVACRAKVLRGVTKMAAEFLKPGSIRFWHGETIIESDDESVEIVSIFNASGLESRVTEHIYTDVWTKLVVNCVVNPLTAIFHVRNSEIWTATLKNIRHSVVRECVETAEAEGITLPKNLAERIDKRVAGYTNYSSMYQDTARGRRTEIDFLNGKIVELAKKHGIQTPVNETLVSMIKFMERRNEVPRNY